MNASELEVIQQALAILDSHLKTKGDALDSPEMVRALLRLHLEQEQREVFAVLFLQPAISDKLMSVLDEINGRWDRGTLRTASVPANPDWAMRRELMSQSYTTRLDQLWTVRAS